MIIGTHRPGIRAAGIFFLLTCQTSHFFHNSAWPHPRRNPQRDSHAGLPLSSPYLTPLRTLKNAPDDFGAAAWLCTQVNEGRSEQIFFANTSFKHKRLTCTVLRFVLSVRAPISFTLTAYVMPV